MRSLSSGNWFAVLERPGQVYLQVGYGHAAGTDPGRYVIEHRAGSADRHYRRDARSVHDVVETFRAFAVGASGWSHDPGWTRVDLGTR